MYFRSMSNLLRINIQELFLSIVPRSIIRFGLLLTFTGPVNKAHAQPKASSGIADFSHAQYAGLGVKQCTICLRNKGDKKRYLTSTYDVQGYLVRLDSLVYVNDTTEGLLTKTFTYTPDRRQMEESHHLKVADEEVRMISRITRFFDETGRITNSSASELKGEDTLKTGMDYTYNEAGLFDFIQVHRSTARDGDSENRVSYTYDTAGRLVGITYSNLDFNIRLFYDAQGRIVRKTDNDYCELEYQYDRSGRERKVIHTSNMFYDCEDPFYEKSNIANYESARIRYETRYSYKGHLLTKQISRSLGNPQVPWLNSKRKLRYDSHGLLKCVRVKFLHRHKATQNRAIFEYRYF